MSRWSKIHDAHIATSFTESFAGIETLINEFLDSTRSSDQVEFFVSVYPGDFFRVSPLEKYQTVLRIHGNPFDKGSEPYQSANLVRRIRNYFVHYEPEWLAVNENEPDSDIGRELITKDFELNPFREEDPFFPGKCLSYGCAKWTFSKSMDFVEEFLKRVDSQDYFQRREWLERELRLDWEELDPNW